MVYKSFCLLGDDPKENKNVHSIDIDISHNLEQAKASVADSFSIVDADGVAFQSSNNTGLEDLDALVDEQGLIVVTINGHAVREIPAPDGLPFIGTYLQIYPDHLGNHQRLFERFGPVIKHVDMGRTTYLTNDPAVAYHCFQESPFWSKRIIDGHPLFPIKNPPAGIFTGDTDTEAWRKVHKFLPAALNPKAVRLYTPDMQKTAMEAFKVFDEFDEKNEAWNAFPYMFKLASQAVGKLALGADFQHFSSVDAPLHPLVRLLGLGLELNKKVSMKGSWYSHLPFGDPAKLRQTFHEFHIGATEYINKAQELHKNDPDLPIDEAALQASSIADFAARAIDEKGNKLPRENLIPALSIVLGAGFTTTASLLSWLLYCLTTYPGVQEKLLQELIDSGVDENTKWTFDKTNEMRYLDKVIKETQRLHNPSYQPARTAERDQILPGGYRIKKDSVMVCAIHHIHTNPKVWANAATYDPERWDTDAAKNRAKASYAPFALGPRSCIGFNFALQEVKTVLPTLLYRYEFSRNDDDPIEYDPDFQLIRPMNLYIRAKRRTTWPEKSQKA